MKIENITETSIAKPATGSVETQVSARDRAINAFMNQSAQAPVSNPTQVSPEEMPATRTAAPKEDVVRQDHISEESTGSVEPEADTRRSEPSISSQYAILAKQQKALRLRDQQLKMKAAEIRAKEEALKSLSNPQPTQSQVDISKYVDKERLKTAPFEVLAEMGLTYDQLTNLALNAPKPEDVALQNELKALRDEIKGLKGETEQTKKTFEEQQANAYKQALNQIRNETKQLVRTNPGFETIRATNSVNDVVELIETTFKEDGYLLSVEEASRWVEDYLVDEAVKLARLKKIQTKLQPRTSSNPQAATNRTATGTRQSPTSTPKTLTNSLASSRGLSARERAILAFEGRLNNK